MWVVVGGVMVDSGFVIVSGVVKIGMFIVDSVIVSFYLLGVGNIW